MQTSSIDKSLDAMLDSLSLLVKRQHDCYRVDGAIIGTGQSDFTQGNTRYLLQSKINDEQAKPFYMFDVPGIEGNESKYENLVKEAVAKSHLIFYVNGTNKKPEKITAEKIKKYLGLGCKVYVICNLRGFADSYEFEEDRVGLDIAHPNAKKIYQETMRVLEASLGFQALAGGQYLQGLLAFSGLTLKDGQTTIDESRDDLMSIQRDYLEYFSSEQAMLEFSQLTDIQVLINSKQSSYKADIVEANKDKIKYLLQSAIKDLSSFSQQYDSFKSDLKDDFSAFRKLINKALDNYEDSVRSNAKNKLDSFFNEIIEACDNIVKDNFDDKGTIEEKINKKVIEIKSNNENENGDDKKLASALQEKIDQAFTRLGEDVARRKFQARLDHPTFSKYFDYDQSALEMDLDIKGIGYIAFNLFSYASSGFVIGSFFPAVGNVIGAAAGFIVGVVMSALDVFMTKSDKIRSLQKKIKEQIKIKKEDSEKKYSSDIDKHIIEVNKNIIDVVINPIDEIEQQFSMAAELILKNQIIFLNIKQLIEEMPCGTIQAI